MNETHSKIYTTKANLVTYHVYFKRGFPKGHLKIDV